MNFFKLREVMNESTSLAVNCDTHEFFGGISESFCEFNLMMNESCLAIDTDVRMGNEILIEAVMNCSGENTLSLINEGVFGSVIDKIKAFFRKIIEYIKGIINKIKLFINGMSRKTNIWHGKMKKAVEDAARNKDITRNFEWMGYDWNHGEIDNIKTKADDAATVAYVVKGSGRFTLNASVEDIDKAVNTLGAFHRGVYEKINNASDDNTYSSFDTKESDYKVRTEKALETYKDDVKAKLGITGDATKYKEAISNLCRGGKEAKPLKGIDSKYSKMLSFIADCTDSLGKIRDSYDTLQKKYENGLSTLEGPVFKDIETAKDITDDHRKRLNAATSHLSDILTQFKAAITYGQGVYNDLCSLQLSLTKECALEYMKVLTKLAMAKPSKA